MVIVEIERRDHRIISFTLRGHAASGPYGHDLVCAGVSAVSFGTINAVEALCGIELPVELEDDGGFLYCEIPALDATVEKKVQTLLEGMVVSIRTIVQEYGQYISLIE